VAVAHTCSELIPSCRGGLHTHCPAILSLPCGTQLAGAGRHSLTCAGSLAKADTKGLVLEARDVVGGLCSTTRMYRMRVSLELSGQF
jgi:NAD(P)-binding Rossmann-like domain